MTTFTLYTWYDNYNSYVIIGTVEQYPE